MSTFSQRISVSANDAIEIPATSPNLTENYIEVGDHGGSTTTICRFTAVGIAQGATINTATITFTGQDTYDSGTNMYVYVGCEDVDDSAIPTTTDGNVANRAASITTAKTEWNIKSIVKETTYPINVKDAVQEVVSRAGWVSGNNLSILITDKDCANNEWQQIYAVDGSATKAPILAIDYTDPAVGGQPTPARTFGIPTGRRRDRPGGWN